MFKFSIKPYPDVTATTFPDSSSGICNLGAFMRRILRRCLLKLLKPCRIFANAIELMRCLCNNNFIILIGVRKRQTN